MKVCLLTHTFPRFTKDTAAPFMDGVARGIQEAGNEVFVLTPFSLGFRYSAKSLPYQLVTYKYIFPDQLHQLGYSQTLANDMKLKPLMIVLSPLMFLFGFLALLRLVKREKIELINAHWILPNGFIAALVSKLTKVPLVSTLPGSDVYLAQKNLFFAKMAKFAASISVAITSNSPELLKDLSRIGVLKNKFSVILYGVDPKRFCPNKRLGSHIKKQLGIDQKWTVVLSVGRLVAKKGFKYLIEAAPAILKKNSKVTFVIIGEGDQRKELEELIVDLKLGDHFLLPGAINYQNLKDYYNAADVFILPSIRDEKGNLDDQSVAVVEAMSCGKAIVATDFPGYKAVVQEGKTGFLVREKDVKGIARVVEKLITNPNLRKDIGGKSRQRVKDNFSWKAIGEEYSNLFAQIVK